MESIVLRTGGSRWCRRNDSAFQNAFTVNVFGPEIVFTRPNVNRGADSARCHTTRRRIHCYCTNSHAWDPRVWGIICERSP